MRRNFLPAWAALCCLATAVADGRSVVINQNPRPAAVLQSGRRVVVQDAPDGVALYDRTGTAVRRFSTAGSDVSAIAVTSDEARLLVGCDDGSLWLFDLQAGGAVWVKTGEGTGLGYVYDVSFATASCR